MEISSLYQDIFAYAVTGGIVLPILHPIDVLKTRLQISRDICGAADYAKLGFKRTIHQIYKHEGIRGFYKGFIPAIPKEMISISLRCGLYEPTYRLLRPLDQHDLILPISFISGAITGAIATILAHPYDNIKIRMMSERGKLGLYGAMMQGSLYQGLASNAVRGSLMNGMFYHYYESLLEQTNVPIASTTKLYYPREGWDVAGYLATMIEAGLYTSIITTPLDIIRTRLMRQKLLPGMMIPDMTTKTRFYTSAADVALHLYAMGDGFYLGFIRTWIRYSLMIGMQVALYHTIIRPQSYHMMMASCDELMKRYDEMTRRNDSDK